MLNKRNVDWCPVASLQVYVDQLVFAIMDGGCDNRVFGEENVALARELSVVSAQGGRLE